jgi:hypothetical protein
MISTGITASVATRITGSNGCLTLPESDCSHIAAMFGLTTASPAGIRPRATRRGRVARYGEDDLSRKADLALDALEEEQVDALRIVEIEASATLT